MTSVDASLEELNHWMRAHHLHGFWMPQAGGTPPQRTPYLWKWADIYAGLLKAGDLVQGPTDMPDLPIRLQHPEQHGIPQAVALSPRILTRGGMVRAYASLKNEACFVVQTISRLGFYRADGEDFSMEPGDLIVSPAGIERAYINRSEEPAIWLDAVDTGLLGVMGLEIDECPPLDLVPQATSKPIGYFSATQDRMKALSSASGAGAEKGRPPVKYPWTDTFATLTALVEHESGAGPYDGFLLRYTSPVDRGPTLPTFSCEIQLLTPGLQTRAHRHNSTVIYYVVRGEGRTDVAGEWLEWTQGDIFCVPPWTWHHHKNSASADAILYSVDDWPAMAKLGFYRVEGA